MSGRLLQQTSNMYDSAVAVIGMGCWYPGAPNLRQFWENILARRQEFRRFPDQRLPISEYHDPDPDTPDKSYGTRAALVDGFEFDWVGKRVPKATVESTDIVHWLALEVALNALEDAGYTRETVATERSGVVLGNTLTGEHTRSNTLRTRWPYVRRVLHAAAEAKGFSKQSVAELMETMEAYYKSVFAPVNEDTLAGALSNTIAGRICNFLDFHGGGYTVDGACSSSLIAVATAANALTNGDLDLALAGGVDVSLDTFELIGFAKAGALTAGDMTVYDAKASGFIPGEGCSFVVLKRLEDARTDGDYVYAVLRGWGISSDGKGGITAPSSKGQARAFKRAYERAGYSPREIAFVEGHGTGTRVGDVAELEGIAYGLGNGDAPPRTCGVTSLKSIIGHTKAAAGCGAFIKTVMSVNRHVLPPTAGCKDPNQVFKTSARSLYPIMQGELRNPSEKMKAGVSAAGFGGINCHVTVESGDVPSPKLESEVAERALLVTNQETEVFILGAASIPEMLERVKAVAEYADGMSIGEMADLAALLSRELSQESPNVRAAVIASGPDELADRLSVLEKMMIEAPPSEGQVTSNPQGDVLAGNNVEKCRVAFLFPGQGSQRFNMGRILVERHEWASQLMEQILPEAFRPLIFRPLDRAVDDEQVNEWKTALAQTEVSQPSICFVSLLWLRYLEKLGIRPTVVGGHSLGELTAFHAAGAYDHKTLLQTAIERGQAYASVTSTGTMASLACPRETAEELCNGTGAVVANINSPNQTVVSGEVPSVQEVVRRAEANGIQTRELPVSNAFHSPLVSKAADYMRANAPVPDKLGELSARLFSSTDGNEVKPGIDLREHFACQVLSQVNFIRLVENFAQECDVMVEVGPGKVLSGLARDIIGTNGPACLPVQSKPGVDGDLNKVLGNLFVRGMKINWEDLYRNRLVRPFVPASEKHFIENPCERPFDVPEIIQATGEHRSMPLSVGNLESMIGSAFDIPQEMLSSYLSQRGDFIAQVIKADLMTQPASLRIHESVGLKKTAHRDEKSTKPQVGQTSIPDLLRSLIEQRTGFPQDTISLDMRLLDDLNLDSIKAAEFVAEAAKSIGVEGEMDPSTFANATLAEIAEALNLKRGPQENGEPAKPGVSKMPVSDILLGLVEQHTGFPRDTISLDMRLLDDLNLDSIKAAEFVAEAARSVGIEGQSDPSKYANATLAEIADVLQQHSRKEDTVTTKTQQSSWVRSFVVEHVAEPVPVPGKDWQRENVVVACEPTEAHIAEALSGELASRGASVQTKSLSEVRRDSQSTNAEARSQNQINRFIVVFPRMEDEDKLTQEASLKGIVERLEIVAKLPNGAISCIQFGGGYFGEVDNPPRFHESCSRAFINSIHLERPGLEVRVIDFPSDVEPTSLAEHVINELSTPETYATVGYDSDLVRHVPRPRLLEPAGCRSRDIQWSPDDVVLVTGGAKGITAECAFAFAQSTGVRMALVGSSPADSSQEIQDTLDRYKTEGLTAQYYQCNIVDPEAVAALIDQVRQELGEITGVIHGAGRNKPRRVEQASADDAYAEVTPKVLGALNLCQALASTPPKLFVGFSSIIGVTGMMGNAWYGFSNESLNLILRRFEAEHPETAVIAIAFSIWDEVGMGARMGSVDTLAKMGIGAIPKEEGVRRFLQLVQNDPGHRQVIVAARLGSLDTWRPERPAKPSTSRFLESIVEDEPGVEVLSRVHLSLEQDLYVQDHIYNGSYLFPTVFGLEAMSQAVSYAAGESRLRVLRIQDIRLERPIVVDPEKGVDIEIHAEVFERDSEDDVRRVHAGIRTEQTGFTTDHFSATFVLYTDIDAPEEYVEVPETPLDIQPKQDLYGGLLFQGPRFQRLQQIHSLDSERCVFRTEMQEGTAGADSFSDETLEMMMPGDPFFRDTLLQVAQLCASPDICLPVFIESIELCYSNEDASGLYTGVAINEGQEGKQYNFSVFAVNQDGRVIERLKGYRAQILRRDSQMPTAEELADPSQRDEQKLRDELASRAKAFSVVVPDVSLSYLPELHKLSREERHQYEMPILRHALRRLIDGPVQFRWLDSGKPVIDKIRRN